MKHFLFSKSWKINLLYVSMIASFVLVPYAIRPWLVQCNIYQILLVSQGLIQAPVILYLLLTRTNPRKVIPMRPLHPLNIFLLMLMAYSLIPFTTFLNLISQALAGSGTEGLTVSMPDRLDLNLLFVAALPAVSEELACRGILYGNYKKHGVWMGAVISGLFFGMLHMNWNQFSYAFVIGVVFALAVEATGSIFGGMVMHFTFNANSVLLLHLLNKIKDAFPDLFEKNLLGAMTAVSVSGQEIGLATFLMTALLLLFFSILPLFLAYLLLICISKIAKREPQIAVLFGKYWLGNRVMKESALPESDDQNRVLDIFFVIAVVASIVVMTFLK